MSVADQLTLELYFDLGLNSTGLDILVLLERGA